MPHIFMKFYLILYFSIIISVGCSYSVGENSNNSTNECGNNICEQTEDATSCPVDCSSFCDWGCGDNGCERENYLEINKIGIGISHTITEGILSDSTEINGQLYRFYEVVKVYNGLTFIEGLKCWIPFDTNESYSQSEGSFVIGFYGNKLPTISDDLDELVWHGKGIIIPSEDKDESLLGIKLNEKSLIAIVTISDQNESFTTFNLIESVQGNFPDSFSTTWSHSVFPVNYPVPSSKEYIVTFEYLNDTEPYNGSVSDFRENNVENYNMVISSLNNPIVYWNTDEIASFSEYYKTGWSFNYAKYSYYTTVTGRADECCTGAGGTFISHSVDTFLNGSSNADKIVLGGHGYYGTESCSDQYIIASSSMGNSDQFEEFLCSNSPLVYDNNVEYPFSPENLTKIEDNIENRELVDIWINSEPPVLRLHSIEESINYANLPGNGIFSEAVSIAKAVNIASPSLFTVEDVITHKNPAWYEVTLSTTFSLYQFEHLKLHNIKIAFKCGDSRLLQKGKELVGFFVFDNPNLLNENIVDYSSGFIIPGAFLPNEEYIFNMISALPHKI
ncbi:MAG: hypothetical protein PF689_08900 [Deltaproteobacteria bacterium]|jgi:hypothetical protein|nr:hypothetical protein [Deltaproteobacteria bacterium]